MILSNVQTNLRSANCSIFFHNYYGSHEQWLQFFAAPLIHNFTLFYNIVDSSKYNKEEKKISHLAREYERSKQIKKIIFRLSSNRGKDIGGKLVLLDAYLHLNTSSEYIVFLHDKRSPHKIQNKEWQTKLFRIMEPSFIETAISAFENNNKLGIVASAETVQSEYDSKLNLFNSNNGSLLKKMMVEFNINISSYYYVAGTMFWVRAKPLIQFFNTHPPLEIRKMLEEGAVMDENNGTYTHSWERLLCWIILSQGYTIKEL